jgi:hypothetical protein
MSSLPSAYLFRVRAAENAVLFTGVADSDYGEDTYCPDLRHFNGFLQSLHINAGSASFKILSSLVFANHLILTK